MASTHKFSIIMPCYNSDAFVKKAIESVLLQSYSCWELVAVNDGSTDNTPLILQDYAAKDSRITIVNKKNGGYATAINAGLEHSTGEYFLMMGSDDTIASDLLKKLNDSVNDCDILPDCIVFQTQQIKNNGLSEPDPFTTFVGRVYQNDTSLKAFSDKYPEHSNSLFCRDTSKCFRKEKLGDLCYFGKYGIAADGIFTMLFGHRAGSFLCIPYVGYIWNCRNDSVSSTVSLEKIIDQIKNWTLFYRAISDLPPESISERELLFIREQCRLIRLLDRSFKKAFKYRAFIKTHGMSIIKTAKKYRRLQYVSVRTRITIMMPVLTAGIISLKKRLKELVYS